MSKVYGEPILSKILRELKPIAEAVKVAKAVNIVIAKHPWPPTKYRAL